MHITRSIEQRSDVISWIEVAEKSGIEEAKRNPDLTLIAENVEPFKGWWMIELETSSKQRFGLIFYGEPMSDPRKEYKHGTNQP